MLAQKQPPTPSTASKDGRSRDAERAAWDVEREQHLPAEVIEACTSCHRKILRAWVGRALCETDKIFPWFGRQARQNLSGVPHLSLLSLEQVRNVPAHRISVGPVPAELS